MTHDSHFVYLDDDDPRSTLIQSVIEDKDLPLYNLVADVLSATTQQFPDEMLYGPSTVVPVAIPDALIVIIERRMRSYLKEHQEGAKDHFIKTLLVRGLKGCYEDFDERGNLEWARDITIKLKNVLGLDDDDTLLEGPHKPQE